jgi:hypothetical protein
MGLRELVASNEHLQFCEVLVNGVSVLKQFENTGEKGFFFVTFEKTAKSVNIMI